MAILRSNASLRAYADTLTVKSRRTRSLLIFEYLDSLLGLDFGLRLFVIVIITVGKVDATGWLVGWSGLARWWWRGVWMAYMMLSLADMRLN